VWASTKKEGHKDHTQSLCRSGEGGIQQVKATQNQLNPRFRWGRKTRIYPGDVHSKISLILPHPNDGNIGGGGERLCLKTQLHKTRGRRQKKGGVVTIESQKSKNSLADQTENNAALSAGKEGDRGGRTPTAPTGGKSRGNKPQVPPTKTDTTLVNHTKGTHKKLTHKKKTVARSAPNT